MKEATTSFPPAAESLLEKEWTATNVRNYCYGEFQHGRGLLQLHIAATRHFHEINANRLNEEKLPNCNMTIRVYKHCTRAERLGLVQRTSVGNVRSPTIRVEQKRFVL